MPLGDLGRSLVFLGLLLVALGGIILLLGRVPRLGRLPGDILVERGNFRLYAPIATGLLLSLVLTVLVNLLLNILARK
jgi:Protein of unknown function (DUF2905)